MPKWIVNDLNKNQMIVIINFWIQPFKNQNNLMIENNLNGGMDQKIKEMFILPLEQEFKLVIRKVISFTINMER